MENICCTYCTLLYKLAESHIMLGTNCYTAGCITKTFTNFESSGVRLWFLVGDTNGQNIIFPYGVQEIHRKF